MLHNVSSYNINIIRMRFCCRNEWSSCSVFTQFVPCALFEGADGHAVDASCQGTPEGYYGLTNPVKAVWLSFEFDVDNRVLHVLSWSHI